MNLYRINDLSDKHTKNLLETAFSNIDDKNIIKNYHPKYKEEKSNIFYILNDSTGRYKNGCYYLVEENNKLVCAAGWNEYELDNQIALALTRAYIDPKFRGKYVMAKHILPEIISATKKYPELYITVNRYNKTIYDWLSRYHQGKSHALGVQLPEIYKKFRPVGKKTIYFTEQYVLKYFNNEFYL